MKNPLYFLIVMLLASCSGLPKTSCDCEQQSQKMQQAIRSADSSLALFDAAGKPAYRENIDALLKKVKEAEELEKHCAGIYKAQGACAKARSLWDCGEYMPGLAGYSKRYTGDWEKDSLYLVQLAKPGNGNRPFFPSMDTTPSKDTGLVKYLQREQQ